MSGASGRYYEIDTIQKYKMQAICIYNQGHMGKESK